MNCQSINRAIGVCLLTYLAPVTEWFNSECVSTDVYYHPQLEPISWMGCPHRLPIIHCTPQLDTSPTEHRGKEGKKELDIYRQVKCK